MLLTEYNEQVHINNEKGISFEEGRVHELVGLVNDGDLSVEVAARRLNITPEEFERIRKNK